MEPPAMEAETIKELFAAKTRHQIKRSPPRRKKGDEP